MFFAKPLQRSNLCASHRQRRWLTHGELSPRSAKPTWVRSTVPATPSVSSTPWPGCSGRPQWAVICDAVTAFEKTLSAADRQALQRMIKRR